MTAALEGAEWSAARPGRTLPPGKIRHPFYRRLDGPQGRSGRAENLIPTWIRSRTVQPVVSRYTDWATRPTHVMGIERNVKVDTMETQRTVTACKESCPVRIVVAPFEMWCWRRMEKISWSDRVRNEVLQRVKEERSVLHTVKKVEC